MRASILSAVASMLASMLAAAPVPAGSAQVVEPPRVTVTVDSFSFSPAQLHLAAGQTVTMVFVNRSGSGHDYSAPDFFARATIRGGTVRAGKVDLPPHSTRALLIAPAAGTYKVKCSHFLHASFGMRGSILVD